MFFLTPPHVKQGKVFLKDATKLLAYKRDLWSEGAVHEFEEAIGKLKESLKGGERASIEASIQQLDKQAGINVKPVNDAAFRENCEVFLVAIVIALGVRTYFLQPFTIPTGSMQPTLNGIVGHKTTEPPPNLLVRLFQTAAYGRTWIEVISKSDDEIINIEEITRWGYFTRSRITTGMGNIYEVNCPKYNLEKDLLGPQHSLKAGEVIARGYYDTGDHVFVDKFSYHFRQPRRGDVFVFNTKGIPTDDNQRSGMRGPSQYYIKRLAGVAGDELEITAPILRVNGQRASGPGFENVMACTNGYRGYANRELLGVPGKPYKLEAKNYFALGDNSYNSSDSRYWGPVPERNIMGRGVIVYWPFTSHFGLIK